MPAEASIIGMSRGWIRPTVRRPVVDMIDVSDSTRSLWSMARVCPIMPPIETPTTWARSMPRWSSRPIASSARSSIEYGALPRPIAARKMSRLVTRCWRSLVERPVSRLS